jgi:hypothetical protein
MSARLATSARWNRREVLVAGFVLAFVAIQVALPIVMFTVRGGVFGLNEEPHTGELPFSWQMFTIVPAHPTASVTYRDGTTATVDLVKLLGSASARMEYDDSGGRAICAAVPGAAAVTVELRGRKVTQC